MFHLLPARLALLAILAALASGCVSSEQPLSPVAQATPDRRLTGVWKNVSASSSSDEEARVRFDPRGIGHIGPAPRRASASARNADRSSVDFYVTRTGKGNYLNLFNFTDKDGSAPANQKGRSVYVIAKYQLSADGRKARVRLLDSQQIARAVKAGRLEGRLGKEAGLANQDVLLKDSSENLLCFIESPAGGAAFGKPQIYRKIH